MKYLVTIRAHYFEIDKPFEKIIRSYFQERMTDFLIFHEGTESSLSVFLKEDLPDEVRTELTEMNYLVVRGVNTNLMIIKHRRKKLWLQ